MPFIQTLIAHPFVLLFLLANLAIGVWAHMKSQKGSFVDYAVASRSLPTGVLVLTLLATLLDGGYLSIHYGKYRHGLFNFSRPLSFLMIGTFIAPRLVCFDGCLTIGDVMAKMYGRFVRIFSGMASLFFSFVIMGTQIQSITFLAEYLLGIPPALSVMMFGGTIVLYGVFGGMRAVSYTDVFQIVAGLMAFTWVIQALLRETGGGFVLWQNLQIEDKMAYLSLPMSSHRMKTLIFWNFSFVWALTPPIVQRMLTVQDKRDVRKMWYGGALLTSLVIAMIILIVMIATANKDHFGIDEKATHLLLYFVKRLFAKQPWLIQLLFAGLSSLAISTMDSYLHSVGLSFVQDVINPIKALTGSGELGAKQKMFLARLGILLVGILSLVLGATDSVLANVLWEIIIIHVYAAVILPLIIGVVGIKTDQVSWFVFVSTYASSIVVLWLLEWSAYGCFLLSASLGIFAYFLAHLYIHGGIFTLRRERGATAETLWVPSLQGMVRGIGGWLRDVGNLAQVARLAVFKGRPTQPLAFSMSMFCLYVLGSIVMGDQGGDGFPAFMAGLRVVGIALCCGLMLEGVWPRSWKPYFPLYWFVSLWYCLPLGGAIAFLRMHESTASMFFFVGSFVVLALLVGSRTFTWLTITGLGAAHLSWYVLHGSLPADLWSDTYVGAYVVLGILAMGVWCFVYNVDAHADDKLFLTKALSAAITHEVTDPLDKASMAGVATDQVKDSLVPMANKDGDKGYWLSERAKQHMEQSGDIIYRSMKEVNHELHQFNMLIDQDVRNAPQQEVSLLRIIEEVRPTLMERYTEAVKVHVHCVADFKARLLPTFFRNVLANLLKNAKLHGRATQLDITIDGSQRKVHIKDNGVGIPAKALPHVFDLRFTTNNKKGRGVGLALTKLILNASGAKINCHTRHGDKHAFTEFVITFPDR